MKIDYKHILLSLVEYACVLLILFTGNILPVSIMNILIFVLSIFLGLWYIWTVRYNRFNLNTNYPKDARIVPVGPYKYVRHPVYLSILLLTLVIVVEHYSMIRAIAWILLLLILFIKLIHEERIITRRNSDYLIYKRNTKRLIPFVY